MRPPCRWRIQRALIDAIVAAIRGPVGLHQWLGQSHRLRRHFFDTPRQRQKQTVAIQAFRCQPP